MTSVTPRQPRRHAGRYPSRRRYQKLLLNEASYKNQTSLLQRVTPGNGIPGALRVAFYVRVSTEEQADKQTPRNQIEYMDRRYVTNFAPDSEEPWQLIGTFVDEGVSGTIPFEARPQGGELLKLAKAGGVDLVVFLRLDRFGRRVTIIHDAYEQLDALGVKIQSATEPWETRTPVGRMIFGLLAVLAEFERELIKERFANGRDRHARADEFINGVVPFGYEVVNDKLTPSQVFIKEVAMSESQLAIEIFRRVADGQTSVAVAGWLNGMAVPSTKVWSKKNGERTTHVYDRWWPNRISRMIHVSLYYGARVLNHNSGPIEQEIPGLVSYELWERANKAIGNSSRKGWQTRHREMETFPYLLTGRLYCAECSMAMQGNKQRQTKNGKLRLYYACARVKGGREAARSGECKGWGYVNGVQLEQWAIDDVDSFMADPVAATQRLRESVLGRQTDQAHHETLADRLRLRLAELEGSKPLILRRLITGRITEDMADFQLDQINSEMTALRLDLGRAESKLTLAESLEHRLVEVTTALQALRDAWYTAKETNDRAAMQQIIARLLGNVEVHADGRVNFHWLVTAPGELAAQATYSFDNVARAGSDNVSSPDSDSLSPVVTIPRFLDLPARRTKTA